MQWHNSESDKYWIDPIGKAILNTGDKCTHNKVVQPKEKENSRITEELLSEMNSNILRSC
jgi:hypothetical protein